jgi:hypothetical protein
MTPKEREQLTASLKYAQDALRDGRLPEGVRPSYQDQVAKLRMRLGLDAAPVTPPVVTGPAPTPTPSTSTTTAPEPPSGLEDRRLKIPPRYRAVWRVLYRWAGSSKRMDRVVVTNLATIARTLAPDWNGFSTRVVRSAIEYLSQQKGIGVIDVRREPQVVAQKSGCGAARTAPSRRPRLRSTSR